MTARWTYDVGLCWRNRDRIDLQDSPSRPHGPGRRPALEILRWAAATFGDRICLTSSMTDAVLIHLVSRRSSRASTCCSSTPATTSPRRSAPGTRSRRSTGERDQRDAVPHGRRAGRRARPPAVRPQPGPVLLPAQGRAAGPGAGPATTPGSPASAGTRPSTPRGQQVVEWDAARGWSRSTRSPRWTQATSTTTSPTTACWSTRCTTTGTPRSAARPAPARWRRARTRAAAGGPGLGKTECGIHL